MLFKLFIFSLLVSCSHTINFRSSHFAVPLVGESNYISYVKENHETDTNVTNTHGSFGPYSDKGVHETYSIGISTTESKFLAGIEYNIVNIKWGDVKDTQYCFGGRAGFQW